MHDRLRTELVGLLPRLRRFARGLTGSAAEADDLVQAACERALRQTEEWRPETRLDGWMFRVVRNLFIDGRRGLARQGVHMELAEVAEDQLAQDARPGLEARFALDAVRRAMAELPEDQRALLLLVCVEGLSYRDCAETLGIPIGTVMSRLARARLALAARLERPAAGDRRRVVS